MKEITMNYKQMNLEELEIERLNVRERIILAKGVAKKDLNKYLAKLNERVGVLRSETYSKY